MKKYEMMARYINEIGCMVGGYYKSLNGSTSGMGVLQNKTGKRQGNTCFLYYGNKPLIEDLPCHPGFEFQQHFQRWRWCAELEQRPF